MALKTKLFALATVTTISLCGALSQVSAQVKPYRATPLSKGQCGTPLTGPCVAATPYGYVPTTWRRWPVTQASATVVTEELPVPTPAAVPSAGADAEPSSEDASPRLPMTPDLPGERMSAPGNQRSNSPLPTPFGDAPSRPGEGQPQVPLFGDEPIAPPSAADPSAVPFSDEPPQPPIEGALSPDALPTAPETPAALPADVPAATPPESGMPFDVGPEPTMPSDDPFKDDPDQDQLFEPKAGARLERAYREMHGLVRHSESNALPFESPGPESTSEPRLLRADGGNLDAARLPEVHLEANPLRQASHPTRRTNMTQEAARPVKPAGAWRRNPLRD